MLVSPLAKVFMTCCHFSFGVEPIALIAADTSKHDEEAEGHCGMQTVSGQEGTATLNSS